LTSVAKAAPFQTRALSNPLQNCIFPQAVKHCATQNRLSDRLFPQPAREYLPRGLFSHFTLFSDFEIGSRLLGRFAN
jgi:hypothetical protein